jgi:glycosyltransferase involved in cell wall biosynthesis
LRAGPDNSSPPSVAICIPTRNQADHIAAAVRSARRQEYAGPIEIWVGDDASTDHTEQVLAALGEEIPDLRVTRQATTVGIPANCSTLMRQPDTDYIVRLDSDDELEPDYVRRLVTAMEAHPGAGYGHSAITQIDERGERLDTRRLIRSSGYQDAETALRASLAGYRTVANILTFRREALEAMSFYEGGPQLRQDYDLAVRMADGGYGNVYLDEPLARYRVWTDAAGTRAKRKAAQLEGYRLIFEKSFEPAWERRGWDRRELDSRRRKLALHHCAACFEPQYSKRERQQLIEELRRLGDSRRLAVRIQICELGGAPLLSRLNSLRFRLKTIAKTALKPVMKPSASHRA